MRSASAGARTRTRCPLLVGSMTFLVGTPFLRTYFRAFDVVIPHSSASFETGTSAIAGPSFSLGKLRRGAAERKFFLAQPTPLVLSYPRPGAAGCSRFAVPGPPFFVWEETPELPTVSLCMCLKDEAATLAQAIESILPAVDEVVIGVD